MHSYKVNKGESIKINTEKTTFVSKACSRKNTGLTITNKNKVSIVRSKKRQILAMIYQYGLGKITDSEEVEKLKGIVNFSIYIDPEFLNVIIRKYGKDAISKLYKIKS